MISNTKEPLLSILLVLAFSLLSCCCLAITPWLFSGEGWHLYKYFLRALLIAVSILILMSFVQLTVIRIRHHILKNIALILCSILFCLYLLELIIMFIPISTGGASSLCSKNWFQYHWQENDYGYRDKAIAIPTVAGKRNILIVGDSYVAGHGIDDPTNRFSDLLSNQIKASFHTFNLGVCGIDTHEEFEGMLKYPVEGDIIVLTHTPNDIRDVAPTKQKKVLPSSSFGSFISESSFLVNFIKLNYSNYVQTTAAEELKSSFQSVEEFIESELSSNHLVSHYNDKVILSNHFSQLDRFINYARENNKILIVLLFPLLSENNFDISNEYMNSHLEHYLIKNKALVINLHPVLENIPAEDRIVGRYDNHPSELVHERVADHLSAFLVNLITESARKAH